MGLFSWLERKLFTGEVIRDYGVVAEQSFGVGRVRTSVLLCRRSGGVQIVVRAFATAPMSVAVKYVQIEATTQSLAKLEEAVRDARGEIAAAAHPS